MYKKYDALCQIYIELNVGGGSVVCDVTPSLLGAVII